MAVSWLTALGAWMSGRRQAVNEEVENRLKSAQASQLEAYPRLKELELAQEKTIADQKATFAAQKQQKDDAKWAAKFQLDLEKHQLNIDKFHNAATRSAAAYQSGQGKKALALAQTALNYVQDIYSTANSPEEVEAWSAYLQTNPLTKDYQQYIDLGARGRISKLTEQPKDNSAALMNKIQDFAGRDFADAQEVEEAYGAIPAALGIDPANPQLLAAKEQSLRSVRAKERARSSEESKARLKELQAGAQPFYRALSNDPQLTPAAALTQFKMAFPDAPDSFVNQFISQASAIRSAAGVTAPVTGSTPSTLFTDYE